MSIMDSQGNMLAMRISDRSGKIAPITIPTPEASESQSPGESKQPFTSVILQVYRTAYETVRIEGLQVFPGITTQQEIQLIPLSEFPDTFDGIQIFRVPPQNL